MPHSLISFPDEPAAIIPDSAIDADALPWRTGLPDELSAVAVRGEEDERQEEWR